MPRFPMSLDEFIDHLHALPWPDAARLVADAFDLAPIGTQAAESVKDAATGLAWRTDLHTTKRRRDGSYRNQITTGHTGSWGLALDAAFPAAVHRNPARALSLIQTAYQILDHADELPESRQQSLFA